jgi:hypothetical protein
MVLGFWMHGYSGKTMISAIKLTKNILMKLPRSLISGTYGSTAIPTN